VAKETGKASKGKKEKKIVVNGIVHIQSTFNNTIITITDMNGNVIASSSPGQVGFISSTECIKKGNGCRSEDCRGSG